MRRRWNDPLCRSMTAYRTAQKKEQFNNRKGLLPRGNRAEAKKRHPERCVLPRHWRRKKDEAEKLQLIGGAFPPDAPLRDPLPAKASNGGEPLSFIYLIRGHLARQRTSDSLISFLTSRALSSSSSLILRSIRIFSSAGQSPWLPVNMPSSIIDIQRDSRELPGASTFDLGVG